MLHIVLKYPEVYMYLTFVTILTIPLELRAGVDIHKTFENIAIEDGAEVGVLSDDIRKDLNLDQWRQHTHAELILLEDLKISSISIDKISQFSVRQPEFQDIFNFVGEYYRWFSIVRKKSKEKI
jgi:hypothetical protein